MSTHDHEAQPSASAEPKKPEPKSATTTRNNPAEAKPSSEVEPEPSEAGPRTGDRGPCPRCGDDLPVSPDMETGVVQETDTGLIFLDPRTDVCARCALKEQGKPVADCTGCGAAVLNRSQGPDLHLPVDPDTQRILDKHGCQFWELCLDCHIRERLAAKFGPPGHRGPES